MVGAAREFLLTKDDTSHPTLGHSRARGKSKLAFCLSGWLIPPPSKEQPDDTKVARPQHRL